MDEADTTRIWLIRHGEVESGYVGTFLGSTDAGLSDLGRHQAQALSAFLADMQIDAVVSSPKRRCLATAAPTAAALGLDVDIREGLREMHFGEWEGKTWPQIESEWPEDAAAFVSDANKRCPDGDDTDGFARRIASEWHDLLDAYRGKAVAIFAHAGTNRAVLSQLTGLPYLEAFVFAQDYGCVNAAMVQGAGAQVALLNFVPGPRAEAHGDGGRNLATV